jgi:hypothetical protein
MRNRRARQPARIEHQPLEIDHLLTQRLFPPEPDEHLDALVAGQFLVDEALHEPLGCHHGVRVFHRRTPSRCASDWHRMLRAL